MYFWQGIRYCHLFGRNCRKWGVINDFWIVGVFSGPRKWSKLGTSIVIPAVLAQKVLQRWNYLYSHAQTRFTHIFSLVTCKYIVLFLNLAVGPIAHFGLLAIFQWPCMTRGANGGKKYWWELVEGIFDFENINDTLLEIAGNKTKNKLKIWLRLWKIR